MGRTKQQYLLVLLTSRAELARLSNELDRAKQRRVELAWCPALVPFSTCGCLVDNGLVKRDLKLHELEPCRKYGARDNHRDDHIFLYS